MKIEMEEGNKRPGVCLMLIPENRDEEKILVLLEGATVSTIVMATGPVKAFLVSLPLSLKKECPAEVAPSAEG